MSSVPTEEVSLKLINASNGTSNQLATFVGQAELKYGIVVIVHIVSLSKTRVLIAVQYM